MKLRTKLFLSLGCLLFTYAIIILIVPTIVIYRDIDKVQREFHTVIVESQRKLLRDQEVLIEDILQRIRDNINASLYMVSDQLRWLKDFIFDDKGSQKLWDGMVSISNYNPDIGFIQFHAPYQKKTAVLMPGEAILHPFQATQLEEGIFAVVMTGQQDQGDKDLYVGIELPLDVRDDTKDRFLALLSWDEVLKHFERVQKEVAHVKKSAEKMRQFDAGQVFISPLDENSSAMNWLSRTEMLALLVPLVTDGFELFSSKDWVPEGLARMNEAEEGALLLAKEVIGDTPLFNDVAYYASHTPPALAPSIAEGSIVVTNRELQHVFLVNTAQINDSYLSFGTPIDTIARQLAVWAGKSVLVRVGDQLWMGFSPEGELYSPHNLETFVDSGILEHATGVVTLGGKRYYYANLSELEGGRVGIYELSLLDGKHSIGKLSSLLARGLSWKISTQLFVISVILLGIILVIILQIALKFAIRPVVMLATATEKIVQGRYHDMDLPRMGKRKDEVAILTHAFENMAQGLKEKEKIRGVLDKVVSKDVANEILKSNIHLGGEDRVVTVLFGDIRGFTSMTENLSPQKTIGILNACMTKITHTIEGEGGVIDKYVGDEVMAIYGAPTSVPEHAHKAVASGVMMIQRLKKWNDERVQEGEVPLEMGIGIHTGLVVAGNMGAEDRLNYTVLGANVNLAARLCDAAKPGQLIISEQTYLEPGVKDAFYIEPIPPLMLKGFSEPIRVYHVIDFRWEKGS